MVQGRMKNPRPITLILLLIFISAVSAAYLRGTAAVPFHPDESTRIFTSSDGALFLHDPSALFWREEKTGDLRQAYRELDAPLANYLIAFARWLAGNPQLDQDWDWGKTWPENEQAGALPSPSLLLASRLAIACLFPLSLALLFFTARRFANELTAWVSVFLLASNALALLHTRRAMAEGLLLFTSIFTLWLLGRAENKRWLVSIPAALALCAKQSLAPLLVVGLAASLWPVGVPPAQRLKNALAHGLGYTASVLVLIFFLHPFLWENPASAIQAAARARQQLAASQVADRPEQALNSPTRRLVSLVGNLYFNPPMIAETGNYLAEIQSAAEAYLANPLHTLFRSLPGGAALFALALFGVTAGILRTFKAKAAAQRRLILLLAATFLQAIALYWLIPLPWQRYYLPLAPYACLWAAYGVDQLRQASLSAFAKLHAGKPDDSYTAGPRQ